MAQLRDVLVNKDDLSIMKANDVLDRFCTAFDASVCYVMDRDGNTVVSSNRNDSDSFVGQNYAFRPYFKQAILGNSSIYMALGVTSQKRGVYFSHPVYDSSPSHYIGVATIKASIEPLESYYSQVNEIILLTDPHGVIFASNHGAWLYQLLWEPTPELLGEIARTRQFGDGPWNWIGIKPAGDDQITDSSGNRFLIHQTGIDLCPGWKVVQLASLGSAAETSWKALIKSSGPLAIGVCVLLGVSVAFLYKTAILDIRRRIAAEESLRLSETNLHRAEMVAHFGNWEFILGSDEVKASDGARVIYGLGDGDWSIREAQRIPLPEYRPMLDMALKDLIGDGKPYNVEFKIRRPTDGKILDIHSIAEYSPEKGVVFGVIQDVTDRKRAEEALRETSEELDRYFTSSLDLLCIADTYGYFRRLNPQWEQMLGYTLSELEGTKFTDLVHPEDFEATLSTISQLENQTSVLNFVNRYRCKDGSYRWIEWRSQPLGKLIYAVARDITDRKLMEAELLERERLFSQVFHQSPELIGISRQSDGCYLEVNDAFVRGMGYSREETIGRTASQLNIWVNPKERETFLAALKESRATHQLETTFRRKTGEVFPALCSTDVLEIKGEPCLIETVVDLTESRKAEEEKEQLETQLRQSQKMEAIGTLAGGIAHDFNNLLQVINGYTEMVLQELPKEHPYQTSLTEVSRAGKRAARLVGQLLAFSRRQVLRPENLDMNEVIAHLLKMLGHIIGEHIRLDFVQGHRIGTVCADRGMMEQILINVCVNARDAMVEGGTLTIETEDVLIDDRYCQTHRWASPGRYVLVSLTDTGTGMDRETLDRIFEPFFTTKALGQGTGLGLAMVYGIVKQHQGLIHVNSGPAKGTTFRVYLPVGERIAGDEGSKTEVGPAGGNETILLAEDDEMVRNLATIILERGGYRVLTARDGEEALDLFRESSSEIDLLLLDIVMPGMGGRTVYEQARKLKPAIPVLFASGYTENAVHTNFVLEEGLRLIQKPFSREDLLRSIRETLDERER